MSGTAGALKEGWTNNYGTRYNDAFFRGKVTVTGTATVTLPLPIRFVGFPVATAQVTAAGSDPTFVSVGNITGATFTIYLWKPSGAGATNLIASTTATVVDWMAWGSVTDNFTSGAY